MCKTNEVQKTKNETNNSANCPEFTMVDPDGVDPDGVMQGLEDVEDAITR